MKNEGKKGKGVRLYIMEADEPALDDLCARTGLSITNALTLIVSAGLKSLREHDYRVTLPLEFKVTESEPRYAQKGSRATVLNERKG